MARVKGYNITFKANNKFFMGETSSNFAINAEIKDSLEKADKGNKKSDVIGHTITFTINGTMYQKDDGQLTSLNADDVMELALKSGEEALIPFIYARGDKLKSYKGDMIITSYSEDATAEGEATYALNCQVNGELSENS